MEIWLLIINLWPQISSVNEGGVLEYMLTDLSENCCIQSFCNLNIPRNYREAKTNWKTFHHCIWKNELLYCK